jgi:hypothetical protein
MANKNRLKVGLAVHDTEEDFIPSSYYEFTPEERGELRNIFTSAIWKKAYSNAKLMSPHLFPQGMDTALGVQIGNNRLHQLQGWELLRMALIKQTMVPAAKRMPLQETYPDAGRFDLSKKPEPEK